MMVKRRKRRSDYYLKLHEVEVVLLI